MRPGDADITGPGAATRTVVITARQDLEIRRQVVAILEGRAGAPSTG
jgi:acetate kinase